MNELSIIFDKMNINTFEVLEAAGTKWNFLKFQPGLVGGHCIGVDPYYLTYKSNKLGYDSQVILAGRSINDGMAAYVAKKVLQHIIQNMPRYKKCKSFGNGSYFQRKCKRYQEFESSRCSKRVAILFIAGSCNRSPCKQQ